MRLLSLLVVLAWVAAVGVTTVAGEAEADTRPSFYGVLKIPPDYFSTPESQAAFHNLQPGSVILTNGDVSLHVPVSRDGSFVVYRIPYGTYLLQADYHDFIFPTVRVEVQYQVRNDNRINIIRAQQNDYPVKGLDGTGMEEENPMLIPATGFHAYYIPRPEFNVGSLLKNPMILMMVVSFGLMGLMKLFPEEDMKESQKMSREWQKKMLQKANALKGEGQ